MKKAIIIFLFFLSVQFSNAQMSCTELIDHLETGWDGSIYTSYDSDAITSVTFYAIIDDDGYDYYYAIVVFESSFTQYIYQVSSETENNYAWDSSESAGKAFWSHIQPYNDNLDCGAYFE